MKRDSIFLRPEFACLAATVAVACGQSAPTGVTSEIEQAVQFVNVPAGHSVAGSLAPAGPPLAPPQRVGAGGHCIIDLSQAYVVTGSLSGSLTVDFRIITYGPCPPGPPAPGTFDEVWIAHGTFTGTLEGSAASASFSYVAKVRSGGNVKGTIVLGDGLGGALKVQGNFADGALSYRGRVTP